jgi:CDP-diacylglycerol---glycerol-3-phosphate 3-phosphatidyltransferase
MTEPTPFGAALWRMPLVDLIPLLGLPAFWIVSCLIFGVLCLIRGMPRTERIDRVAKSPYLPRFILEFGYWMFTIPVNILLWLRISANTITLASLVATFAGACALGMGYFALGGWTLFFAFTLDAWDGIIARRTGTTSVAGEFFDSTIDRYNDQFAFLGLMYYYRNDPLPLALGAMAMVGSTLVSYARAKGESVGVDPNVGYMQRHERAVYLGLCTVFAPIVAAFVEPDSPHPIYHLTVGTLGLIALLTNITAVWRMRYVLTRLKQAPRAPDVSPDHPSPTEGASK